MKRSTERILTTHVGSLIRPKPLQDLLRARQNGEIDDQAYAECLKESVAGVVRRQAEAGIDIVDDGEFGKNISWSSKKPWLKTMAGPPPPLSSKYVG